MPICQQISRSASLSFARAGRGEIIMRGLVDEELEIGDQIADPDRAERGGGKARHQPRDDADDGRIATRARIAAGYVSLHLGVIGRQRSAETGISGAAFGADAGAQVRADSRGPRPAARMGCWTCNHLCGATMVNLGKASPGPAAIRPVATASQCAAPIPANRPASVPVIQTWPPAPPSRSNKAARRSGIEMGGDLVEEQDRAAAGALGDEIGMGEDEADQQRLLLAGRGRARRAGSCRHG